MVGGMVPYFRAQRRLRLTPTQLAVLMHLADYWWDVDRKPYPSKQTLAERLGKSPRQVQRIIAELEAAGLVERVERRAAHKGKLSNIYDLSGLVKRLKELEPEFREVEEEVRSRRKEVARPGLRRRGLSRKRLGRELGVDESTIARWERSGTGLRDEHIALLRQPKASQNRTGPLCCG